MKIPFTKLSGSGNDFIVIDHRTPFLPEATLSRWVAKICAHRLSVGADGVILIEPASGGKADFRWRLFNADGSPAEMSGNGGRCAARFAHLKGIAKTAMVFETPAGLIEAEVVNDRVKIRFTDPTDFRWRLDVTIDGTRREGHFVNTGVPHLVYLVDDVDAVDLIPLGRASRFHPLFHPAGTNVNVIQRLDPHRLKIRTYERGVEDETLACGTGSVASALVAATVAGAESPVTLLPKGGQPLTVTFAKEGQRFRDIFLAGDARVVYDGEMGPEAWEY
ncbi:MAG TPA: diaminopimelate epimerase [Nitrospiria bacterium]|nr:diaminopimelate epimerase [Nitrospiria bacterium]